MNKFFYYYNSLCMGVNTPNSFSFDPYITAIKEMLVFELQQIVYYIEKLKKLNVDMTQYRDKVIDFISILIVNLDFNKESFFVIVEDLYNNKKKLEETYIRTCKEINDEPKLLADDKEELINRENIIKILNERKSILYDSDIKISTNNKVLYELMINLVFNACNGLIELKNYGIDFPDAKDKVLNLLNTSNFPKNNTDVIKQNILEFAECNYEIVKLLDKTISEKYGPINNVEVMLSQVKGKSILVSGTSFLDLEKILISALGTNINVYTHHEMINAHLYENLKKYPNLKGHYQLSENNFSLDFAKFPGPIYISRNFMPKIDVIRGQIYTSARYPSFGISKIENDDFEPIINFALKSKGFNEDTKYKSVKIGITKDKIDEITNVIADNLNNLSIKHIFIIGVLDMFTPYDEYLNKFISECPKDCCIISFSENPDRENLWQINSYYDFTILYNIIEELKLKINNIDKNVSIFLTECNANTISHIFNLINLGIKNIFVGPCCPNMINPVVIDGLNTIFNVKTIDTPKHDIDEILK